ncbi:MAG: hypothetical protein SZ59_C0002G0229 [candidate division TM6 bacterium GW2011_GWF2_28_16]|nr:MAG: hypothetical protein SZ59_C0002G0229 [candidate division TM6 bacterium GW2011_GWF2_28_16]
MSIKILTKIIFSNNFVNLDQEINFAFYITKIGIQNKIGINCGGNIAKNFSDILKNSTQDEFIFEITDDPMDINSENLFSGDCPIDNSTEHVALVYESLESRMNRVQNFIQELLNNKDIKNISMDIDALNTFDYQEFETINIKVQDFTKTMIDLFEKHNQFTPTVRINFIK